MSDYEKMYNYTENHTDNAMGRFFGDYELYVGVLNDFLQDETFMQLEAAILMKDYHLMKKAVHTLKGVAVNLRLQELYEVSKEMLELLNDNKNQEAMERYEELQGVYYKVMDQIKGA